MTEHTADPADPVRGGDASAVPGEGVPAEAPEDFPRVPDAFARLWTPHRMVYIGGENKPADDTSEQCPFCSAPGKSDEEGLVVARGEHVYAVLNLYPYNPGHLLLCPYRHVADYTELTEEEMIELARFSKKAMQVARAVAGPSGFNLGLNQGPAGGAGIAAHLHQHVVPRWSGDANFLPIVAQTKALPQVHHDVRELYARAWGEDAQLPG